MSSSNTEVSNFYLERAGVGVGFYFNSWLSADLRWEVRYMKTKNHSHLQAIKSSQLTWAACLWTVGENLMSLRNVMQDMQTPHRVPVDWESSCCKAAVLCSWLFRKKKKKPAIGICLNSLSESVRNATTANVFCNFKYCDLLFFWFMLEFRIERGQIGTH